MGTSSETFKKEYADFEAKVKRTVFVDNFSPQVTKEVLKTAFGQFGTVLSVEVITNYFEENNNAVGALVEMENAKQAKGVIEDIRNHPFMMSGMPRPVRGQEAKPEMFDDRPRDPIRKIDFKWVEPEDEDFEVAQKMKDLVKWHAAEASLLLKFQMEEEEKLAKQQSEMLNANYKKYESIENIMQEGALNRLARHYKVNVSDD
ncbi:hypothetical protein QJS10_CPA02g00491 [Acorus calamus]|uniref:RRM domain-containing protein n=1 Tax=Acorus calamus TaxID=4465 RepID=A0AAV9FE44_ACOCL|nr:hypothetical protein QJS10_CPA02g00491 [Acorus calamus]